MIALAGLAFLLYNKWHDSSWCSLPAVGQAILHYWYQQFLISGVNLPEWPSLQDDGVRAIDLRLTAHNPHRWLIKANQFACQWTYKSCRSSKLSVVLILCEASLLYSWCPVRNAQTLWSTTCRIDLKIHFHQEHMRMYIYKIYTNITPQWRLFRGTYGLMCVPNFTKIGVF